METATINCFEQRLIFLFNNIIQVWSNNINSCFLQKKIVYFVFIFKIMYSFSKYEYKIKNPFSHLSLFVPCFEYMICEQNTHLYTFGSCSLFLKATFFTYLSDLSETSHRGRAEHFQFYKENGIIFILAENVKK